MRRRRRPYRGPSPSVDAPRPVLLAAVLQFACAIRRLAEVRRLALIGSLTTAKAVPKDADLLVVIDHDAEPEALARAGRRLKGAAQKINLGADIFLGRLWSFGRRSFDGVPRPKMSRRCFWPGWTVPSIRYEPVERHRAPTANRKGAAADVLPRDDAKPSFEGAIAGAAAGVGQWRPIKRA